MRILSMGFAASAHEERNRRKPFFSFLESPRIVDRFERRAGCTRIEAASAAFAIAAYGITPVRTPVTCDLPEGALRFAAWPLNHGVRVANGTRPGQKTTSSRPMKM
jgi:hypothetical protein